MIPGYPTLAFLPLHLRIAKRFGAPPRTKQNISGDIFHPFPNETHLDTIHSQLKLDACSVTHLSVYSHQMPKTPHITSSNTTPGPPHTNRNSKQHPRTPHPLSSLHAPSQGRILLEEHSRCRMDPGTKRTPETNQETSPLHYFELWNIRFRSSCPLPQPAHHRREQRKGNALQSWAE